MNSQNDPYYSNFLRENLEIHDQLFTNQNPSQSTLPYQNPTQTESTTKKAPQPRNFVVEAYLHGLTLILMWYKAMIKNVRHVGKEFAIIFISTSILHLNASPIR